MRQYYLIRPQMSGVRVPWLLKQRGSVAPQTQPIADRLIPFVINPLDNVMYGHSYAKRCSTSY